jgi:ATP-binding cassette subfamily B protein
MSKSDDLLSAPGAIGVGRVPDLDALSEAESGSETTPDPETDSDATRRDAASSDELLSEARASAAGDGSSKRDRQAERELVKQLLLPRKRGLALLGFISFMTGLFEAVFLLLITQTAFSIADDSTSGVGPVWGQTISVGTAITAAIVLVVLRLITGWMGVIQGTRITKTVSITLGRDLTEAFLGAGWEAQHGDRPGRLQELLTSFARHGVAVTGSAAAVVRAILSVVVLLAAAVAVNPAASLIAIVGVVLLGAALRPLRSAVRRQSKRTTETSMSFATALSEVSDLGMEMNVFGVQPAVGATVEELIVAKERQNQRLSVLKGMVPLLYSGMAYLAIVIAIAFVSQADTTTAASAGAAMLVMLRSLSYGQLVQTSWAGINASIPYYRILDDEIRRYRAAEVKDHGVPIGRIGEIQLDDVSYAYTAGQPVLHNVTATLEPNEVIGIIGPSGGGKSTLVQVLLGLRTPDKGRVLSNGRDIQTLSRTEWARKVTFVPQHTHLVAGTIEDNIRFFRADVTHDDVVRAAELAQLAGDVDGFKEGYSREVGERGSHLSGGQQQRLTIARALVEKPDLLILDEPTSALDVRSEAMIREALDQLREHMTIVVIAHRLSTIDICDRLMVIQDGYMRGFDRPEALERESHFYRESLELAGLR